MVCGTDRIYVRLIALLMVTTIGGLSAGIFSIYFSQKMLFVCNHQNYWGLDLGQYLLGSGIIHLFLVLAISTITIVYDRYKKTSFYGLLAFAAIQMLVLVWAAIGGELLIDYNMECIEEGTVSAIFALIQWIYSMVLIVLSILLLLTVPENKTKNEKIQLP